MCGPPEGLSLIANGRQPGRRVYQTAPRATPSTRSDRTGEVTTRPLTVNLHAESVADPAHRDQAAAEARTAQNRFRGLGEKGPSFDQHAPRRGVEQEDAVVALARPHQNRPVGCERPQLDAFERFADLDEAVERAESRYGLHCVLLSPVAPVLQGALRYFGVASLTTIL